MVDSKTFNGWEGNLALFRIESGAIVARTLAAKIERFRRDDYTIRADGPRVQLSINRFQTVDYVETDPTVVDSGVICVQIHGGPPSEAWYGDITVAELTK